jgi:hypothetical protein
MHPQTALRNKSAPTTVWHYSTCHPISIQSKKNGLPATYEEVGSWLLSSVEVRPLPISSAFTFLLLFAFVFPSVDLNSVLDKTGWVYHWGTIILALKGLRK